MTILRTNSYHMCTAQCPHEGYPHSIGVPKARMMCQKIPGGPQMPRACILMKLAITSLHPSFVPTTFFVCGKKCSPQSNTGPKYPSCQEPAERWLPQGNIYFSFISPDIYTSPHTASCLSPSPSLLPFPSPSSLPFPLTQLIAFLPHLAYSLSPSPS